MKTAARRHEAKPNPYATQFGDGRGTCDRCGNPIGLWRYRGREDRSWPPDGTRWRHLPERNG
jgi:hypothetical protein